MAEQELHDSRFNLWRAIVAMIHVDGVVQPHEVHFIVEQTRELPLSIAQRDILKGDLGEARDIKLFFDKITRPQDREDFFRLARAISWSDGHYDRREEDILARLNLSLEMEGRELLIPVDDEDRPAFIHDEDAPRGLRLGNLVRSIIGRAG